MARASKGLGAQVAAAEGALLAQQNRNQELESQLKIARADTQRGRLRCLAVLGSAFLCCSEA